MSRNVFRAVGAVALCLLGAVGAQGQEAFPSRPVRIVVSTSPGATTDITARLAAKGMTDSLRQSFIVDNKPGGGYKIGREFVRSQPADGYTLLGSTDSSLIDMGDGFDLVRDFTGIGQVSTTAYVLVTSAKGPVKSLPDFLSQVKARPGELSYASGGLGSGGHMAMAKFLALWGKSTDLLHVPYKGGGPARTDVAAGRVTVQFTGVGAAAADIAGGHLRALGVTSATRHPLLPDVPTIAEQGFPNFTEYQWVGLFVKKGTPRDRVLKLAEGLQKSNQDLRKQFEGMGSQVGTMPPDEFNAFLEREKAATAKLVNALGIKFDALMR